MDETKFRHVTGPRFHQESVSRISPGSAMLVEVV
jgi:hypothetical protein